ncbi:dihydroxyacetone kinase transcriptional activator DhaS [Clostridium nigeriense]|uniref:dihydroxyacetone kinase transcriptional activator DhaS n=1 Tax=Clostridium nigeriense TaxID=1805470 RepID=UPI003D325567
MSRSIATKKMLAESLKKIMKTKPLNKVSVKDIVNDCNLNRHTFYYHFKDIYDLIEWIYKTEAIEGIAGHKNYENWTDVFYSIFLYIENNKEFCYNTLNSLSRNNLEMYLFSVINNFIMGVIEEVAININVKENDKKFIADFYTHAFSGIVMQWMRNGMKEDPKVLIEKLKYLIEGSFIRALNKYETMA